jgi:CMP/dCMP kinase
MAKITIFGLAGTGKSSVGKLLAERLGYEYVSSGNMMRQKAVEAGLTIYELNQAARSDPHFDQELDEAILQYGKEHDNFVLESWLGWHFVPDAFKIKLLCDTQERIKRIAARESLSFEEAEQKTESRDQAKLDRYYRYYGIKDFPSDEIFDLVLDTTVRAVEEIVGDIKIMFFSSKV